MEIVTIKLAERNCNGCTKCCEGWLHGEAHGKPFWAGRKCFFMKQDGCSIYETRPEKPCRSYECEWLKDKSFPEWMKPNESRVVVTKRKTPDGEEYYEAIEAGEKMDSTHLSWILQKYITEGKSIVYYISGGLNYFASKNVIDHINNNKRGKRGSE